MFEWIFFICFIFTAYYVVKYLISLDSLLQIENADEEVKKLTLIKQPVLSKFTLMKDMKFFFCVVTGSYKKSIFSGDIIRALDKSRRFILLQYLFVIVMFLVPITSKFL